MALDDPTKWFKYVNRLQRILNGTTTRSTKWTLFKLLTGVKMGNKEDIILRELLVEEITEEFEEQSDHMRRETKKNI